MKVKVNTELFLVKCEIEFLFIEVAGKIEIEQANARMPESNVNVYALVNENPAMYKNAVEMITENRDDWETC